MLLPDERACEGGINVTVNTVDNLLAGRLQDRSFLVAKFDIEGSEPSALWGAKSILSNEDIAPCWIFAEYNRQMAEASAERHTTRPLNSATALFDILASYQYTAYVIPEVTNASAHLNNEPCQAAYRLQPAPNTMVVSGDYEFWRNDARCMALCAALGCMEGEVEVEDFNDTTAIYCYMGVLYQAPYTLDANSLPVLDLSSPIPVVEVTTYNPLRSANEYEARDRADRERLERLIAARPSWG
jgi:hypothetical protein